MTDKRTNYISKEDMYMGIARMAAMRSKDPNSQVGAVFVSSNDRILSIGYNGFPNGISDDEFPWAREAENEEDVVATTDYVANIHASVERGNIFACQFHPEKSGDIGLKILKNFCELDK